MSKIKITVFKGLTRKEIFEEDIPEHLPDRNPDARAPSQIIPFHLVEILAVSVVYGYILARLFTSKKRAKRVRARPTFNGGISSNFRSFSK